MEFSQKRNGECTKTNKKEKGKKEKKKKETKKKKKKEKNWTAYVLFPHCKYPQIQ